VRRGDSERLFPGDPLRFTLVGRPFVDLPDEIVLTRDEVAVVLLGLDTLDETELDSTARHQVDRAIRLLTTKLWPELGDLLDEEGGE
jgi:hypothetical protein